MMTDCSGWGECANNSPTARVNAVHSRNVTSGSFRPRRKSLRQPQITCTSCTSAWTNNTTPVNSSVNLSQCTVDVDRLKDKRCLQIFTENHLRATWYKITFHRHRWTCPTVTHSGKPVVDWHTLDGWKGVLTWMVGYEDIDPSKW